MMGQDANRDRPDLSIALLSQRGSEAAGPGARMTSVPLFIQHAGDQALIKGIHDSRDQVGV
jgi:hypothetical protein